MRLVCLAAALMLAGCQKHPGSYQSAASGKEAASDEASAALAEADALWDERADPAKLEAALAKYEAALADDPRSRHALVRLTRGWYFYGDAHAPDSATQVERWGRAIEWGARCLALNDEFARQVNGGAKEKDAIAAARKEDAPCIYWTATSLGKWAKAQSLSKTLRFLPTVKAYVAKVEELQPEHFHYGPARYWGAYYAALPSFAGQDYTKSAQYFDASLDGAPYYLGTRVLRAELLAVGTQDVKLFERDLQAVLDATSGEAEGDVSAENAMERVKAQALLARKHELFDKKTLEAAARAE